MEFEMNIVFHIPDPIEAKDRIYSVVEMAEAKAKTEVYRNIRDLSRRLSQPVDGATIGVLLVNDMEGLNHLFSIRHLLSDMPFILILPNRENSMISLGYRLGPRFQTNMDNSLYEVEAVLKKMIRNHSD